MLLLNIESGEKTKDNEETYLCRWTASALCSDSSTLTDTASAVLIAGSSADAAPAGRDSVSSATYF